MVRNVFLAISILFCGICTAQMPPRSELLAKPKFADDPPHKFHTFTEAELRAQTQVMAARSFAMMNYNTPEVRLQLPPYDNDAYAQIDFPDPELKDAAGKAVKFELERGGYQEAKFSDEIRFNPPENENGADNSENPPPVQFAHATGHVTVKYPLDVKTLSLTSADPGPKELQLKIDGPFVSFAEDAAHLPDDSFSELRPVRAYDAAGHRLEEYQESDTTMGDDGAEIKNMAFYGNVARVELDSAQNFIDLNLSYDLTPAPLLPKGHEGDDPASYAAPQ